MPQGLAELNYEHRLTNHEYRSKRKNGNERIQSLVVQYSVFDIRHSEKDTNSEFGIVTQPACARPFPSTRHARPQNTKRSVTLSLSYFNFTTNLAA
jgi:hypothetical protein